MQIVNHIRGIYTIGILSLSLVGSLFAVQTVHAISPTGLAPTPDLQDYNNITPSPQVQIPGLQFATKIQNPGGNLQVPFLAQYISALYKYLLGASVIAAAIMITYGGFLYITGSSGVQIGDGKAYIVDACIGLGLVFGAYTILGIIAPTYVTPKPIAIKAIKPQEFDFMEFGPGFSVPSEEARRQAAEQASKSPPIGTSTPPDPIAAIEQGGISIADVVETGTRPSQRAAAYCTPANLRNSLDTYEKKIAALVKTVLGFQKICIKEAGCAYVRTGFTAIPQGTVGAGIKDFPFVMSFWKNKASDRSVSEGCLTKWNTLTERDGGTKGFYATFNKGGEYGDFYPGGSCYNELDTIYKEELLANMTKQGLIGGDCGSLLMQIYHCAGGAGGQPWEGDSTSLFKYINYSRVSTAPPGQSPGPDFPVWQAQNEEDLKKQLDAAGGPKFGDVFVIGKFGQGQHNFMYTGGRSDVPFDIFEMGGGGNLDGAVGPQIKISRSGGGSFTMGGMRTLPRGSLYPYIRGFGKNDCSKLKGKAREFCDKIQGKAWPVTVARPYSYTACKTKADCGNFQICACSFLDAGKNKPYNPDCSSKNICRPPASAQFMQSYSMICYNDEMCPNGWSCPESGKRCKKN